ncbi:hypothetical protein C463_17273 [Halorubrum californiense DSM 19288]|uniref:Uncharacterized protein n=1 Tax=Halorubrum californiense DSM 19288 TaxID=1227465 RepID=M0DWU3_9EURY|nr:hypothetical protein [Halorubrum californiense]ELZ39192.1 hypothetical protein C463_17273 [Halorubrum californiense DSM 19288]
MRSWLPTTSSTPPRLEATVEQRHLRRLLAPVAAVNGPTDLTVADDGIVATSVDDPMVTAVEATVHQTLCERYSAAPGIVSIDPAALGEVLAAERVAAEPARLAYDPDEATLTLDLPSFVHSQAADTRSAAELPAVGDPQQGATTFDLLPRLKTRESRHGISGRANRPVDFKTHSFHASPAGFQHRRGCLVARSKRPHP